MYPTLEVLHEKYGTDPFEVLKGIIHETIHKDDINSEELLDQHSKLTKFVLHGFFDLRISTASSCHYKLSLIGTKPDTHVPFNLSGTINVPTVEWYNEFKKHISELKDMWRVRLEEISKHRSLSYFCC